MSIHRRVSGSYNATLQAYRRVSGSWKKILSMHRRASGAWEDILVPVVTLSGETVNQGAVPPTSATAGIIFRSDGTVDLLNNSGASQVDSGTDWIIPNNYASSAYEIRATLDGGDTPSGTLNTWLSLGSDRQWSLFQDGSGGSFACSLTIEIGSNSGAAIFSSNTYNLVVNVGA